MPFFVIGKVMLPDKIKLNVDVLPSVTAGFVCLVNHNALYKGSDNLRIQLSYVGVSFYTCQGSVNIADLAFCVLDDSFQFGYLFGKLILLFFIGCTHFIKAVIRNLALKIILVQPLNDGIKLGNAGP